MKAFSQRFPCLSLAAAVVLTFPLAAVSQTPSTANQPPITTDAQAQGAASGRLVGTITAIEGDTLTVKTDAGSAATISVSSATRVMQTVPGRKDLTGATAIRLSDLAVGDRVLARAALGADGKTYAASTVFSIKQADLDQQHQRDREAWQRSGEGGLVKSVDSARQTVTISLMGVNGARTVLIKANAATINRRYAPDSIEFNDARPAPLERVKAGDQLKARGTRNADGSELQADEIVSGTFKNIVATVTSVDAAAGTLTVADLVAKHPAVIHVNHDSQLRKLPPAMAQGLAMRLRAAAGRGGAGAPGGAGYAGTGRGSGDPAGSSNVPTTGAPPAGAQSMGGETMAGETGRRSPAASETGNGTVAMGAAAAPPNGGQRRGELQQALSNAPVIQLSDLQKGDAIMVVTTEGSATAPATAVTLLAGVEPMLQASATGTRSMLSESWNLNSPGDVP